MPNQSRLLVLAISSLLVSSTWASAQLWARDSTHANGKRIGVTQWSELHTGDNNLPDIATASHGRFRRVKRQDAGTVEADAAALGAASGDLTNAIDQGAPAEQITVAAADVVDDANTLMGDPDMDIDTALDPTRPGFIGPQLPPSPPPGVGIPAPPEPPASDDSNTDVADEVKILADETQNFINNTGAALQDDTPFTEENLQELANDIQQITLEMANLPPPALVDVPAQVSDQMQALRNANLTMDELWAKLEVATGESYTKDVQFQTILSYMTPVLAATIAGNITLPATEDLPPIQPVAEITSGSISADAATSLARLRLAKRNKLEKRFLGSLFSFLGIGFAASASASLTTPLGNLGVGVAATLGKLAEVKPPPPEKPQTVYVYEKEYIREPPVVIQRGSQQPAAIAAGGAPFAPGFAPNGGSNGHIDTSGPPAGGWAYYRD
ncbi:hypothetical protein Dda_4026 [Drechslerella dactyloides]|uniref:Uncharacterized protein n=1 Tax=Drechslerella dactyloides TaxID=74499 RepID=A0AAD6NJ17_DREDA|nr:hypothetical protein Dda_4026 [Drechslerella dactyloides]